MLCGDLRLPFWAWVKEQICLGWRQTHRMGYKQRCFTEKEETACSSDWTGRYESCMFTSWSSWATGFVLGEVTGWRWIIGTGNKKTEALHKYDLSHFLFPFSLFFLFLFDSTDSQQTLSQRYRPTLVATGKAERECTVSEESCQSKSEAVKRNGAGWLQLRRHEGVKLRQEGGNIKGLLHK